MDETFRECKGIATGAALGAVVWALLLILV